MVKQKIKIERITPSKAREWIKKLDTNQRGYKPRIVEKIAGSIEREGFNTYGTRIVWSSDGTIIDGQHTLRWIAKQPSDTFFDVLVIRDQPRSSIGIYGGDAITTWSTMDRIWLHYRIRIGSSEAAVGRFLHMMIDQKREPTCDEERVEVYSRWSPVIANIYSIPRCAPGGIQIRKAPVSASIAFATLFNPDGAEDFKAQISGKGIPSGPAKSLLNLLGNWIGAANLSEVAIQQSLRAMRCVEVGTGIADSVPWSVRRPIEVPDDMVQRWAAMYEDHLKANQE